jgi:hypothetical protein
MESMSKPTAGEVVDAATVRQASSKLKAHEPITLDPRGSVGIAIIQGIGQAVGQVLQNTAPFVAAFLEGKGYPKPEEWKVRIDGMEFDETEQTLKITGLTLVPR